ncbi:MAG: hypothetical protein QF858_04125 [Candidatus Pacebacteria bacterium]|jgi:type IV secretory pathway VirB4 component|nr:hypothetical protein [bacterium]MDP6528026.1 hypothetical protein [Candidatus Paceibacterota bacterium]|tara:strand:+ start:1619 stop:2281 length:663 start_codon:yes stop_codon:yes gene_type:complete
MASKASQDFVPIKEVRDGIVVLSDGSLRAILMASSTNFALKSADERSAIVSQFQNFLNSLEFSVQIFIQSRDLDIRPYIALLESQLAKTLDDLMKIQITEYIEFVKSFTENANIMEKNFFVVIPYASTGIKTNVGPLKSILGKGKEKKEENKDLGFEESLSQLEQRMTVVSQGLVRSGVRTVPLKTEEVIELYYKIFNPGELEKPIALGNLQDETAQAQK